MLDRGSNSSSSPHRRLRQRNFIRAQPVGSAHEGFDLGVEAADLLLRHTGTDSKLHGLLGTVILCLTQVTKELTEETELFNLLRRQSVGVEVHDCISNFADFV